MPGRMPAARWNASRVGQALTAKSGFYAAMLQFNGTATSNSAFDMAPPMPTVYQPECALSGDPLNEKRIAPRKRVLKGAFIVLGEKAPKLECTVRNMSDTGALVQVSSTFGLPSNFELIVDSHRLKCQVVWRTDTKIGVKFE